MKKKPKPKQRRHLLVGPDERISAEVRLTQQEYILMSILAVFRGLASQIHFFFLIWIGDIYTSISVLFIIISGYTVLTELPFLHVSPVSS